MQMQNVLDLACSDGPVHNSSKFQTLMSLGTRVCIRKYLRVNELHPAMGPTMGRKKFLKHFSLSHPVGALPAYAGFCHGFCQSPQRWR